MINARLLPQKLVNLTDRQNQYLNDTSRFTVVSAGRRSRKTIIGKRKVLKEAIKVPDSKFIYAAPTQQQAKAIFWDGLKRDTYYLRKDKSEVDKLVILKNGTHIQVAGLDKPERIEGQTDIPIKGIHITEFANVKADAWDANIRPILSDTGGFAILDGVPEGRNHYYDKALYACNGVIPKSYSTIGAYASFKDWAFYTWFSSDVLDPAEMEVLSGEMDERTFRQEFEGSFEVFEGLAYYSFSKANLKNCQYDSNKTVHIGMDFNVNPMTATLSHIDSNVINQFGEVYLQNSNTDRMGDYLDDKFGAKNCIIYPDSSGKNSSSNSSFSDLAILRKKGFTIKCYKNNPRVKDRINAVNSRMKPMDGEIKYYVNSKTCKRTIEDFNKVERLMDGTENKAQERDGLVHISSALGYMINYLYPIRHQNEWVI
jgi:hypothetical protein